MPCLFLSQILPMACLSRFKAELKFVKMLCFKWNDRDPLAAAVLGHAMHCPISTKKAQFGQKGKRKGKSARGSPLTIAWVSTKTLRIHSRPHSASSDQEIAAALRETAGNFAHLQGLCQEWWCADNGSTGDGEASFDKSHLESPLPWSLLWAE